jgi:hypothetical protein
MKWPAPQAGMLIRYSYLWSGEAELGREEGIKDRPCAVVIVTKGEGDKTYVRVLPVTHRPPLHPDEAVEIPAPIKNRLGLDVAPSWIVLSETNLFPWVGPDVRPIGDTGSPVYGFLPNNFFRHVLLQFAKRRAQIIKRT